MRRQVNTHKQALAICALHTKFILRKSRNKVLLWYFGQSNSEIPQAKPPQEYSEKLAVCPSVYFGLFLKTRGKDGYKKEKKEHCTKPSGRERGLRFPTGNLLA